MTEWMFSSVPNEFVKGFFFLIEVHLSKMISVMHLQTVCIYYSLVAEISTTDKLVLDKLSIKKFREARTKYYTEEKHVS